MKNIVFVLIDSLYSDCIGNSRTTVSSTPFLDELIKDGLFAKKVYSYGPYTDAATRGLYCGNKTLDDLGYFYGINSCSENHFKTFHDLGYETIGLYYPYYLIGSKVEQYIDHSVFIGGFEYISEWNGKFSYYANKRREKDLSDLEYSLLIKQLELMFDCWSLFYDNLHNNESSYIIQRWKNTSGYTGVEGLYCEKRKFLSDKKKYLDEVLDKGLDHPLAFINDYSINNIIKRKYLKENIYKKYKDFFRRLARIELYSNLKNNKLDARRLFTSKRYGLNWLLASTQSLFIRKRSQKRNWQYNASMYTQVDASIYAIKNRKCKERPFYLSLHAEDAHNYLSFFSYDVQDQKVLDEDFEYLKPLLLGVGAGFKGNLCYQLALRYTDLCIRRLVDGLRRIGELENTSLIITADHGSSYTFYPIRASMVNNFFKENYQTPLLIYNGERKTKKTFTGMYSAEDTLCTVLKENYLPVPIQYKGFDIVHKEIGRPFVITEYMGPGVPDMVEREIWLSVRNEHYSVSFKCPINKEFNEGKLVSIYDLTKDPLEMNEKSIKEFEFSKEIIEMVQQAEKRFYEIQLSSRNILNRLDLFEVTKKR